ncbi:MAG: tetratricopeptide repeat protein [Bacteroidia bacterium]|nr:tetratricopeptide repeat protein [Bacteroidia bacterium]
MAAVKTQVLGTTLHTALKISLLAVLMLGALPACKTSSKTAGGNSGGKKKELSLYDKRKFETLYFDGLKEKMLGNYSDALDKFVKSLGIDPSASAPHYEIALVLQSLGRNEEALGYAKTAAGLDPSNPWYLMLYAECAKGAGNSDLAAQILEKGIKTFPSRQDFYFRLGEIYLLSGKYEKALTVYNKLEERTGVYEELSVTKQKIWLRLGNVEKAVAEIRRLSEQNPNEPRYVLMMANLLSKAKDERCMDYFNKAIQMNPSSGIPHLYLHDHYLLQGKGTQAFEELKTAFRSGDVSVDSKTKILLEYYERTSRDTSLMRQADTLMRIVEEVNPTDARTFTVIGDFYYRDKKYSQSYDAFMKALALDRSKYAIWHQVMILQSQLDLYPEMKNTALECVELFPNEPAPYLFMGVSLIKENNSKEAILKLKAGKELVIEDPPMMLQFYSYLGEAYHKEQDYKSSDLSFDKALSYDPRNATVLNNYAYYLSLRNTQLEKAEKMCLLAIDIEPGSASYQDTYAWVLYKQGKYADAKIWLEKAMLNGGSSNPNILEHYGDVLFRLGDKEKALHFWESAKKAGKGSDLLEKKLLEKKLLE